MADPFLLAHAIRPFFFEIGGRLSPVSIRDQMIRGRMLVDRAVEAGLINQTSRPLLVIGAGAGGATAAIRAAQLGITTTLIEIAPTPFLRQAGCRSRRVDPTQYDWPVDHWRENRKVSSVTGKGHTCANSPGSCHGLEHEVELTESDCLRGTATARRGTEDCNVLIVRHGIISPTASLPFSRQVLPYHAAL